MPKACNLKKGNVVEIDGEVYSVRDIEVKSPSSRGAATLYKVSFQGIKNRQNLKNTYKGTDYINDAALSRRDVQFLFNDSDSYTFMDLESFNQYTLPAEDLEEAKSWLTEDLEGIIGSFLEDALLCIDVPQHVVLEIVETDPAVKGTAGAGNRSKTAVLSTGVEIQVPEFLETGEMIKVCTETRKFISRA